MNVPDLIGKLHSVTTHCHPYDIPVIRGVIAALGKAGVKQMNDAMPDMTLREEIATLICIHENGIGARELVEAQEGGDHQREWLSALQTAGFILDLLRTRRDGLAEPIRRAVDEAFANSPDRIPKGENAEGG